MDDRYQDAACFMFSNEMERYTVYLQYLKNKHLNIMQSKNEFLHKQNILLQGF